MLCYKLKHRGLSLLLATCVLTFSSCYQYKVSTHAQYGTEATKRNVNAYFWGLVQNPKEITTPNCDSLGVNGMAEVKMKTNLGYALITVITLGIWCPMQVEWRCGKPSQKTGTL